jgi:hypothetical protein
VLAVSRRVQSTLVGLVVAGGILFWSDVGGSDSSSVDTQTRSTGVKASTNMTLADFCYDFVAMRKVFGELSSSVPPDGVGVRLRKHAQQMLDAGPPSEMPPAAQDGFRLLMTSMTTLPDDATQADLSALDEVLKLGDTSGAEAFNQYAAANCLPP